ncbi:MAG: polysaccharide export protein EpsE [Burkholderiales bacterium]|nr:polysaccharide export protein EpsE [Burkholderiales bacterium]
MTPSSHQTDLPADPPVFGTRRRSLFGLVALLPLAATTGLLSTGTAALAQTEARRDYVIGAGDVVRINVYQNPDLLLETRVSESGAVSYPLLGAIKLGGLSVTQAEKLITDGLRNGNFIKQPQVSVTVLQVRGNQAAVLGMVNRPGRYPIEVSGLRLSELLATAGGVAAGGSDIVTLSGLRDGKPMRQQIDVAALLMSGDIAADPIIVNGDTVYVDRMPVVYIYGEVQRPGSMRLERGMTLMQAIATGGGLTQRGSDKGIKLHRRDAAGQVREIEPDAQYKLQDGDVIYVRPSLF